MTNVYDIIARIRDGHKLTNRHWAMMAGLAPTTLESAMQRQPAQIRKKILCLLAQVFDQPWYALMTSSDDETQVPLSKNPNFILCDQVEDEDAERIVAQFLALPTPKFERKQGFSTVGGRTLNSVVHATDADEHLRQTIIFMLGKLNIDGLMDVMGHTLNATKNPLYQRKEDTPCDSDDPQ